MSEAPPRDEGDGPAANPAGGVNSVCWPAPDSHQPVAREARAMDADQAETLVNRLRR